MTSPAPETAAPADPATPHAFGCTSCTEALRAQHTAERMTGRLLELLVRAEAREARQREEIGALEARIGRYLPTWEADSA